MADDTKTDDKAEKSFHGNKRPLSGLAGESGDPDVHFLIAQRDGLVQNRNFLEPPPSEVRDAEVADIDRRIADIDKALAELGYKVQ